LITVYSLSPFEKRGKRKGLLGKDIVERSMSSQIKAFLSEDFFRHKSPQRKDLS